MNMTPRDRLVLRVHLVPPLARRGIQPLLSAFGSWEALLAASPRERAGRSGVSLELCEAILPPDDPRLDQALRRLEACQVRILTRLDPEYPEALHNLYSPPPVLYVRGALPSRLNALAIVGARRATHGTRDHIRRLARRVADHDIAIVSGLARGLDTAAHEGALDANGITLAVLGCGIDRIYPGENQDLAHRILQRGAVISEYPPGVPPLGHHFPARNRIISGLSQGVLVGEASRNSGSLITADFALEQGRELFVLPGLAYSELSAGSNDLLKQGAHPVTEAQDILSCLWPSHPTRAAQQQGSALEESLTGTARALFRVLGPTPCHIDEITRQCGLTPMEVSATLLDLELQGGIEQLPGMLYRRRL